ncbi:MAG: tetratricopeptide repeat protein [Lachnospiraceae bacterium]|nr:tetratricopeptide repeat protein [Lachnospiraceae bacterium]
MSSIPIGRVIEKLDEYLNLNSDYEGAERHLKYWLAEAEYQRDDRGAFAVVNEMIGLYRKCGRRRDAYKACDRVMELTKKLGIEEETGGATAFLNVGTVYKAFGDPAGALPKYEHARKIYEKNLEASDPRLGGLYNNMALTLTDLERYDEAESMFHQALRVMEQKEHGETDCAITYLNLAELEERRYGFDQAEDKILAYMDQAWAKLNAPDLPRDGYYAFAAEKCIPLFIHYEYYLIANELERRIREIRGGDRRA